MSTLRLPRERSAVQATARTQGGIHPPVRALSLVPRAPAPEREACLNCDALLVGTFCHGCGQAAKVKRFTFGAFLHELPHEILHLEHALPHTLKALLTNPGPTIRAYLAGKRKGIYSPLGLLFLLSGLLALAMVTLKLSDVVKMSGTFESTDDTITKNAVLVAVIRLFNRAPELVVEYRAWFALFVLPVVALSPYLLMRKRTGIGYGEQVVVATMIGIGDAAISIGLLPLVWLTRNRVGLHSTVISLGQLVTFAYTVWAYAELQADGQDDRGARWIRSVVACVGTYVVSAAAGLFLIVCVLVSVTELLCTMEWLRHH